MLAHSCLQHIFFCIRRFLLSLIGVGGNIQIIHIRTHISIGIDVPNKAAFDFDSNFDIELMLFDCPGYEIRIITDDCLIIPAVALMLFSLVALIKAPQSKGLLIQASHRVLRGLKVQKGRCL